jgi:HK97 family phage major capsid protein
MSTAYLNRKITERASLADAATAILDRAAADNRDVTAEERAQLDGWETRCRSLDNEISNLEAQARGNANFVKLAGRVREDETNERARATQRDDDAKRNTQARKSFGQRFVDSDEFKEYRGRGTMAPVEFAGFLENRAAIMTGDLPVPTYVWGGPDMYTTTTPLLDVLGREIVSAGSVEYVTWGTSDPVALEVAEGELKPEADITPTETSLSLVTYAHWKAITRQALEDWPRIQSIVEGKLRGGLADALETAAAGVLTGSTTIPTVTSDNLAAGIRLGIAQVQSAGYQPNAVLLNPDDFAALDVATAAAANSGPTAFPTYWGIRPIAVGALDPGQVYVGDFTNAVTWFDRNTTAVYMTDSHADYFVRNLLVVLAEQRAAFAVTDATAAASVVVDTGVLTTAAAAPKGK